MPEDTARPPNLTPKAQADAEEKRRRLAEALRENLKRRKQQARARQGAADTRSEDDEG